MTSEVTIDIDITIMHIISILILLLGTAVSFYLKDASVFIVTLTTAGLAGGWAEQKQNEYYVKGNPRQD